VPERDVTCPGLPIVDAVRIGEHLQILYPPITRIVPHLAENLRGIGDFLNGITCGTIGSTGLEYYD